MTFYSDITDTSFREWMQALPETFSQQGDIIYDARNQIRVLTGPDGRLYNVKRYRQPLWINRIVYTWFRSPKAKRAYHNACRLRELDIPTPRALGYILCGDSLLTESYLITEQSPLQHSLFEMGTQPSSIDSAMLEAFARMTAQMHHKGVLHLDYSPGNILFDHIDGQWRFEVVDINRMQFRPVDIATGCSNFARLWGTPDMIRTIADAYASARNADISTVRRLIHRARHHYWSGKHPHPSQYCE